MSPRAFSRFDLAKLTERQLKTFDTLWRDVTYSRKAIAERFGLSIETATRLAIERNLPSKSRKYTRHDDDDTGSTLSGKQSGSDEDGTSG